MLRCHLRFPEGVYGVVAYGNQNQCLLRCAPECSRPHPRSQNERSHRKSIHQIMKLRRKPPLIQLVAMFLYEPIPPELVQSTGSGETVSKASATSLQLRHGFWLCSSGGAFCPNSVTSTARSSEKWSASMTSDRSSSKNRNQVWPWRGPRFFAWVHQCSPLWHSFLHFLWQSHLTIG